MLAISLLSCDQPFSTALARTLQPTKSFYIPNTTEEDQTLKKKNNNVTDLLKKKAHTKTITNTRSASALPIGAKLVVPLFGPRRLGHSARLAHMCSDIESSGLPHPNLMLQLSQCRPARTPFARSTDSPFIQFSRNPKIEPTDRGKGQVTTAEHCGCGTWAVSGAYWSEGAGRQIRNDQFPGRPCTRAAPWVNTCSCFRQENEIEPQKKRVCVYRHQCDYQVATPDLKGLQDRRKGFSSHLQNCRVTRDAVCSWRDWFPENQILCSTEVPPTWPRTWNLA